MQNENHVVFHLFSVTTMQGEELVQTTCFRLWTQEAAVLLNGIYLSFFFRLWMKLCQRALHMLFWKVICHGEEMSAAKHHLTVLGSICASA